MILAPPTIPCKSFVDDWRRVGLGYSVRFALRDGRLDVQWKPSLPVGRDGRRVAHAYTQVLVRFADELSRHTGQTVAVVEVQ
jgi:hypothetical protein